MAPFKETGTTCVVCGGPVVEKIVQQHNPMTGPPIFGPGSLRQIFDVSAGYHCQQCGIKYEFVRTATPPEAEAQPRPLLPPSGP